MIEDQENWKKYELAATSILNELAAHIGLARVEGTQKVPGLSTGTEWKLDAKGVTENGEALVVIECRRYLKSRPTQEDLGAIAYRLIDTGAVSGIIVTPLGLQEGAQKVAAAMNILSVRLDADATPQQFVLQFLGKLFIRPAGQEMGLTGGQPGVVVSVNL